MLIFFYDDTTGIVHSSACNEEDISDLFMAESAEDDVIYFGLEVA